MIWSNWTYVSAWCAGLCSAHASNWFENFKAFIQYIYELQHENLIQASHICTQISYFIAQTYVRPYFILDTNMANANQQTNHDSDFPFVIRMEQKVSHSYVCILSLHVCPGIGYTLHRFHWFQVSNCGTWYFHCWSVFLMLWHTNRSPFDISFVDLWFAPGLDMLYTCANTIFTNYLIHTPPYYLTHTHTYVVGMRLRLQLHEKYTISHRYSFVASSLVIYYFGPCRSGHQKSE